MQVELSFKSIVSSSRSNKASSGVRFCGSLSLKQMGVSHLKSSLVNGYDGSKLTSWLLQAEAIMTKEDRHDSETLDSTKAGAHALAAYSLNLQLYGVPLFIGI